MQDDLKELISTKIQEIASICDKNDLYFQAIIESPDTDDQLACIIMDSTRGSSFKTLPSDTFIENVINLQAGLEQASDGDDHDHSWIFEIVAWMTKQGVGPTEVIQAAMTKTKASQAMVEMRDAIDKFKALDEDWMGLFYDWLEDSSYSESIKEAFRNDAMLWLLAAAPVQEPEFPEDEEPKPRNWVH